MKLAYFDPSAGASGDMILGALVSAGVDPDELRGSLQSLPVSGWELTVEQVTSHHIAATKVNVVLADEHQPHRHLHHILEIIDGAEALPAPVKAKAKAVFQRLGQAEAKVHGVSIEKVHFHEVGAVDAIVDIVGGCLGLHLLGIEQVHVGPLPITHGWVTGAHGKMPVPTWATMELLQGVPTRPLDLAGEVLTPTGAALLTTLADGWQPPAMTIEQVGYGAGSKDFGIANVLRVMLGESVSTPREVVVLEANIDDMNPEWYELALEKLFAAGALDVTLAPIYMKKGRPAVLLKVLCEPRQREALSELVLQETTTLGIRWYTAERDCLAREWYDIETAFGTVRVKVGRRSGRILNIAPEYESCRACAVAAEAALPAVYAAAREAARVLLSEPSNSANTKAS